MKSVVAALAIVTCTCSAHAYAAVTCKHQDLSSIPETAGVDFDKVLQPIINASCGGCHAGFASLGGLSLRSGSAVKNLVNVPAVTPSAGVRVVPGKPLESFLFDKINCIDLPAGFGSRMPSTAPQPLSASEQALFRDWISQLAPAVPPQGSVTHLGGYLSGNWYNPDQGGSGFQLEFTASSDPTTGLPTVLAIWFTYPPDGNGQAWIYGQGTYNPEASEVTIPAELFTGTRFPPNYNSQDVHGTTGGWGTLTFSFSTCDAGEMHWHSDLPGYSDGNGTVQSIVRLTKIEGTSCPHSGP